MPIHRCLPQAEYPNVHVRRVPPIRWLTAIGLLIGLALLFALPATAAEVSLAWDANREEDLAGYRVYWGTQSRNYPNSADVGDQIQYTVPDLTEGRVYYFSVTAYDVNQLESDYSAELAFAVPVADTDQDGLSDTDEIQQYGTDPNNADTDGDTMSDGWEVAAGLDPRVDDADGDIDGDGLSNLDEYIAWLQTGNHPPDRPVVAAPFDGQSGVPLTPLLQTGPFLDTDGGDIHLSTRWQISSRSDFQVLVFDVTSDVHFTSLPLPESLLDGSSTYYWRVKYIDNHMTDSIWSETARFTTVDAAVADADGDGIPDSQQISTPVDLDQNGVPDQFQPDIKCLHAAVGDVQVGVQSQTTGAVVEKTESLDMSPQLELDADGLVFPMGLISFRVRVPNPGDTVAVRVWFSEPVPSDGSWFKHTPAEGWLDYSAQASFSSDRLSLTFFLTDGAEDDADGAVNGVIVDPAGFAAGAGASSTSSAGAGGSGGCFIGTVSHNPFERMLK